MSPSHDSSTGPASLGPLVREHRPALDYFLEHYVRPRRPVVLTGMLDGWPAMDAWSPEYLRDRLGDREIKVQRLDDDHVTRYELETLERIHFRDLIDAIQHDPPRHRYYLVIGNIHVVDNFPRRFAKPVFPELLPDIEIPALVDARRLLEINLWLGYSGVRSNLHFDPIDNCLCMIRGRKHLRLFSPDQWPLMYLPSPLGVENPLHSPVDALAPDLHRFPRFAEARYHSCVLEPGQMLYLPAGYWHHVCSEGLNVAVNFWWKDRRWALEQLRSPIRRTTLWFLKDKLRNAAVWARGLVPGSRPT